MPFDAAACDLGVVTSPTLNAQSGHGLEPGIVYGPVISRRFGRTLGLNLLPSGHKHCSFNCVYCQLGWTDRRYFPKASDFPQPTKIAEELRRALTLPAWRERPNYIVVSGNGEPTLHPEFEAVVAAIANFRDETLPGTPLVCFTCGSELERIPITRALRRFDECHVKFDADAKRVNLPPAGLNPDEVLKRTIKLPNLVIQSCFTAGVIDNSAEDTVRPWAQALALAYPPRVDIYTIGRATAAPGLKPVPARRLREIAAHLKSLGIGEVRVAE